MPNIVLHDYIDVSRLAGSLAMERAGLFAEDERRQSYPGSAHHDTRTILLRGPVGLTRETPTADAKRLWFEDVPHEDAVLMDHWPNAHAVIQAIWASHERRMGVEPVFGKVMLVLLTAGGWVDWHVDQGAYAEAHHRYHLCVQSAPGSVVMSGMEHMHLEAGHLIYFNNRVPHCAVNFGPLPRIHLIFDVRKPVQH